MTAEVVELHRAPHLDAREPPNNVAAEQALLGALIINNDAFHLVHGIVQAGHFYHGAHQQIFQSIQSLINAGRVATPATLHGLFVVGNIADLSPAQYLARLCAEATTVANAPDYARTVRDFADRRGLIAIADNLSEIAISGGPSFSVAGAVDQALGDLDQILDASLAGASILTIGDAVRQAVDQAAKAYQAGGTLIGIPYGLTDLDHLLGGLHNGEVSIIAGRPGMGKTALAINVVENAAKRGHGVGLCSIEMSAASLGLRYLTDEVFDDGEGYPIPYSKIRRGDFSEADFGRVAEAAKRLVDLPVLIDEAAGPTVLHIASTARRMRQRLRRQGKDLSLLVVDYLQLIAPQDRYRGNKVSETTEVSAALKRLAKELNVPIMVLSQLSREVEKRENKRPQLSDLRDSGAIEQDADNVIFLFREEYYLRNQEPKPGSEEWFKWETKLKAVENTLEAIVGKQRQGATSTVILRFNAGSNAVRDLPREERIMRQMGPG